MWEYRATCRKVVDGDTLDLLIDLGFTVSVNVRVRLARVDTPEVHGVKRDSEEWRKGRDASAFTFEWIEAAEHLTVRTQKTGKYGRWIAEVFDEDGDNLNEALIAQGWGA